MKNVLCVIFISALVSGCASVRTVTSDELSRTLAVYQDNSQERNEISWFQPQNLTEQCQIKAPETEEERIESIYWDGACKDGYAQGLGRLFISGENWSESLLLQIESKDVPAYIYYFVDYSDDSYSFTKAKLQEEVKFLGRIVKINDAASIFDFNAVIGKVILVDGSHVARVRRTDSSAVMYILDKGGLSYFAVVESSYHSDAQRFYYIQQKDKAVGFYQIHFWEGGNRAFEVVTNKEVKVPPQFAAFFENYIKAFERSERDIVPIVKASQEKIAKYRQRICGASSSPIAAIDDDRYFEICKDGGELAKYESSIKRKTALTAQKDERSRQQYLQQLQQRKANAFSWSDAFLAFAKGLEQGGNAMRQSSSYTPTYQAPQVQQPTYFQGNSESLYEYQSNPLNSLDISQTLVDTRKSGSGRTVCVYSSGSTKVLPYGQVVCPRTYP
ncbi:hypothetical protein J6I75_04710 [Pseudidiomarina sp. 1APP75-27a]|uniref:hypothetical protein n=1 Tax=Pseudidiomarina terrestris TaxID=2820060 RepID=UPI002B056C9E|nr:hypothetical protein [Pseudidiomarina sp. 1APP75-27a]MEA3587645.1 hypothetical protein [Pseudidiomarina sp. 1APP75-27a]